MAEHDALAKRVLDGLAALQSAQLLYDADMWAMFDPPQANLRHVALHLTITMGKLARILEREDHAIREAGDVDGVDRSDVPAIVADLLMHAAQIASLHRLELGPVLAERYRFNAKRFCPESELVEFGSSEG